MQLCDRERGTMTFYRKFVQKIIDEMVEKGLARPATNRRTAITGLSNDEGVWAGKTLTNGGDARYCALAAPDCPEEAKPFLRKLVGASEDPKVQHWKNETLDEYLKRYPTHPESHWYKRRRAKVLLDKFGLSHLIDEEKFND